MPYSFFLLLNRESWIASYQSSKDGREILKNLWRLQQTEADEDAIHKFTGGRQKWQETERLQKGGGIIAGKSRI